MPEWWFLWLRQITVYLICIVYINNPFFNVIGYTYWRYVLRKLPHIPLSQMRGWEERIYYYLLSPVSNRHNVYTSLYSKLGSYKLKYVSKIHVHIKMRVIEWWVQPKCNVIKSRTKELKLAASATMSVAAADTTKWLLVWTSGSLSIPLVIGIEISLLPVRHNQVPLLSIYIHHATFSS